MANRLDPVLEGIREKADDRAAQIIAEAEAEAEQIREEARTEAEHIREEAHQQAARSGQREHDRILNRARLDAEQIEQEARDDLMDRIREQTAERLRKLRDEAGYADLLNALADEAVESLSGSLKEGEVLVLRVDPRDEAHLQGREAEIRTDIETWGGVIAQSDTGRVAVENTLEARLEKALPHTRRRLNERL